MIHLNSFLGISIISDKFMSAIEKITAKTKQIHITSSDEDGQEVIEVPVWNGTVANLTLMALGSSAPEILLGTLHKGDAMLSDKEYFRGGKLDRNALSGFIAGSICTSFICLCIYVILSLSISIIMDTCEIIKSRCTNDFTQQWGDSTAPRTGQDMPKLSAYKKKEMPV